jgi:Leucine-rich repeat (LRR) protein
LTDSSIPFIAKYSNLEELILTANEIKTLEGLTPLFALKNLREIDLAENPVAQLSGYRQLLFEKYCHFYPRVSTLEVLDGIDRNGKEVE